MSTYCAIKSKLSDNVIDIQEASTKSGAHLDAFAPKTSGNDNQLWEFVADPAGSGYYFIKSKLSGNVIDVQESSTKSGALLDAFPQKTTGSENQLWTFVPDPAAAGYYFIRNKLSGNVIDIQGASTKSGALLDASRRKQPRMTTNAGCRSEEHFRSPSSSRTRSLLPILVPDRSQTRPAAVAPSATSRRA